MRTISLQSGSNGNCIYVEADGVQLLFDAGISGRQAQQRLANFGCDIKVLRFACLAHLSGDNNYPELALKTHRKVLGKRFPLHVATRDAATGMMEV